MAAPHEREVDPRILDWVDGTLAERERERFVAELRVSAQLRADLAEYERTVTSVRQALQAEVPGASVVAARVADRVRSRLASAPTPAAAPRWSGARLWWSMAAAAALLAFAVWLDRWSPPQVREDLAAFGDPQPEDARTGGGASDPGQAATGQWRDELRDPFVPQAPEAQQPAIEPDGEASRRTGEAASEERTQAGAEASEARPAEVKTAASPEAATGAAPGAVPPAASAAKDGRGAAEPEQANLARKVDQVEQADLGQMENRLALGTSSAAETKSAPTDVPADAPARDRIRGGAAAPALGAPKAEARLPEIVLWSRAEGATRRSQPAAGEAAKAGDKEPGAAYDEFLRHELARLQGARESAGPADRVPPPQPPAAIEIGATRWRAVPAAPPAAKTGADDFYLGAGRTAPVAESAWVVEGPRDDVRELLARLAGFAQREGLALRTGEVEAGSVPAPASSPTTGAGQPKPTAGSVPGTGGPATTGPGGPAASGAKARGAPAAPSGAGDTMRIVLRLQLAPGEKR